MDAETVFSDDPASMAVKWEKQGAKTIHVVDLDGAISKKPVNQDSVRKIVESLTAASVHIGGGVRDLETVRMYLESGVRKVIIGTEAIRNPEFAKQACKEFPGRIILGIDARNGKVAVEGWTETTEIEAVDLARSYEQSGVSAVNFTDIHRDGMQTGPNIEETRKLAESVMIPVIASGGVSVIDDIRNLARIEKYGVTGVIAGRALYSGSLDLVEAVRFLQEGRA